ncbi:Transcription factor bHLH [Abeliophyllum distichum]|uniref:Transcription factor bHLH n=1 Tax=Abeliophyllum distichum TaxID=126358 RepID=A0ABD1TKY4_9LAMI
MEIDECLVNSKGEATLDEFYDLEPILDEIFSSDNQSFTPIDALNSQLSSYINGPQEIISTNASSSSCQLISFGNSNQTVKLQRDSSISPQVINFSSSLMTEPSGKNQDDSTHIHETGAKMAPCSMIRCPLQAQDHVMAERKRREKLNQLFISLSKIVPGLKKLDKASLLGDATKYVQELQERVRILEEEAEEANRNSITSSSKESSINGCTRESVQAEIKARISKKNVLIKICSKKQEGLISRIQYEMEKMHLNVLDIRAMPFGSSTLYITILAQKESEFYGTVKDIVEHLKMAFVNPGIMHQNQCN